MNLAAFDTKISTTTNMEVMVRVARWRAASIDWILGRPVLRCRCSRRFCWFGGLWLLLWGRLAVVKAGCINRRTLDTDKEIAAIGGVRVGGAAREYAFHPLSIRSATRLLPTGAPREVLKRDGRWVSTV